MADQLVSINFAVIRPNGVVHFSDAGVDIVRAVLMKWMEQAQRGEESARAMYGPRTSDYSVGQAAYFKAARTFLAGKLTNQFAPVMTLKTQLAEAVSWRLHDSIPDRWMQAVLDAASEVPADGIRDTPVGGGGSGGDGGHRVDPVGDGHGGPGDPPPTDERRASDHREPGAESNRRKGAKPKGVGRTDPAG